jgi:hypothetical protein
MIFRKLISVSLFFFLNFSFTFSQNSDSIIPVSDSLSILKYKNFKVDSTGWILLDEKIIVGCETSTNMSLFSFTEVNENLDTILQNTGYGSSTWRFESGFSPLSNSYYISTRFGKFNMYSHTVLDDSRISGNSKTRFVSYGYSHLFKRVNLSLSYRNIIGYQRSNNLFPVNDYHPGLRAKDFRMTIEVIGKGSLKYKKYGFSNLYFPVKISGSVNLLLETSYLNIYNPEDLIPRITWQNDFVVHPGTFMNRFSILSQSLNMRFAEVMPVFKRKGEKPYSCFFKLDFIYGMSGYKYYAYIQQEKIVSDFRVVFMANIIGSLQLVFANRYLHTSIGVYARTVKYNEMERKDDLSFTYFYSYISLNLGYRIPFKKGYEKIHDVFH